VRNRTAVDEETPVFAKFMTAKMAAVGAALLLSATAAAAAGALPEPAQQGVSHILAKAGVGPTSTTGTDPATEDGRDPSGSSTSSSSSSPTSAVPDATSSRVATSSSTTPTTAYTAAPPRSVPDDTDTADGTADGADDRAGLDDSTPVGPDATGPAHRGLCTAWFAAGPKNPQAVAFRNLLRAADAAGQDVEEFCADVVPPTTTATGPAVEGGQDGDGSEGDSDTSGDARGTDRGGAAV
jgi:hypothetical protein